MRRDTKVIYGSVIILTTIVLIGGFFGAIQFQYAKNISKIPNTKVVIEPNADITSEIVVVHLGVPVQLDRFGATVELTSHEKINDSAIVSSITLTTKETPSPTTYNFTGIGESQTTPDNYVVRIVNATASSAQILIGQ